MTLADAKPQPAACPTPNAWFVKVGSALAGRCRERAPESELLEAFTADWPHLQAGSGNHPGVVGAIALGRRHLNLSPGKLRLEESQAAAAVGQIRLAHAYKELLTRTKSRSRKFS